MSAGPVYARPLGKLLVLALALGLVAAGVVAAVRGGVPAWVFAALALGLFAVINLGSFVAASGVFGRPLLRGSPALPQVALTFDDGPDPIGTPRVLEVLARHNARATFFVIGERARRHPELLARIAAAGHQIESHSLRHAWSTAFWPRSRLARDLATVQEIIQAACGRAPRWFRPPIGVLSPAVVAAAQRVGLGLCAWSRKARDGLAGTTAEAALAHLLPGLENGAILLLHDAAERGERETVAPAVLERLLPILAQRGLRPVVLDELVAGADR